LHEILGVFTDDPLDHGLNTRAVCGPPYPGIRRPLVLSLSVGNATTDTRTQAGFHARA
jgi:hypothetical protein